MLTPGGGHPQQAYIVAALLIQLARLQGMVAGGGSTELAMSTLATPNVWFLIQSL